MVIRKRLPLVVAIAMAAGVALLAQGTASKVRQLRANGADLAYVDEGKGSPVVFVHGAVGDLRFWEPQRRAFASRHRYIAYTYRYHGTAPWADDGKQYSGQLHADDLAAFIRELKTAPVHLVGLSYGGFLAAIVAAGEPQLLRSLTLAEPALMALLAEFPEGKPALEVWMKAAGSMGAALKTGDAMAATKVLSAIVNNEPPDNPESWEKTPPALRRMLTDNARTLPLLFAAPPTTVTCDQLRKVTVPTLLVRGQHTPEFFAKTNELVAKCIPGARSVVVPNASHAMSYHNPAAFNREVLAFIAQHDAKPTAQRLGN